MARRIGRDVKAVHTDVTALLDAGVIDRTANRKLLFPYHHVKVQFTLDGIDADDAPVVHPVVVQRAKSRARHPARRVVRAGASVR